jgi:murein DD-endopeptidase MepM/ murein hydrolase activator NlpD
MIKRLSALLVLTSIFFVFISPVSAQTTEGPIYIVQPGDSLFSIAQRFNISIDELMNVNNITDPDTLSAGQRLIIPGLKGVTGVLDTQVINFGDSFRSLVRRTQVPVDLLRKLNHVVSPTEFYVGASMIVPQQEQADDISSVTPAAGESLLELSIRNNSDPWTLTGLNDLAGTWDGVPGDVLYAPGIAEGGQAATGLPPAFKNAQLKGLPLMQGRTAVIFVQTDPDIVLGGMLVTQPLHFFPMPDGSQVALQGVHALLEPGIYPLRLDAILADGTRQSYEQTVLVVSGNYPEDPLLRVDPSTIDPAITEPETQRIIAAVQEATPQKFWDGLYITPAALYAESSYFTSRFGNRRTYIGQGTELEIFGFHTGVDFGGGVGLPITAPAAGRVVFTEALTVRGNATIVDHGWGVYSGFWHQSEFKVQVGDVVQQGQILGLVGGTGRVTGAHLHWELWVNGVQVDPLDWLNQAYP